MILVSVIPVWIASHLSSEGGTLGRG
jgi:hypothetical protein